MPTTQIVFLAFGPRTDLYTQIYFALRSIQCWNHAQVNVTVLTDTPEYLSNILDDIDLIQLSPQTLTEWRGKHDFLWRIKMKAIEHVAQLHPEDNILYFDSDTVIAKPIDSLLSLLNTNNTIMHTCEKVISKSSRKKDQRLMKHLNNFTFSEYIFNNNSKMFNAGVIGLPAKQSQNLMSNAINLCDALCETKASKVYLEQLAFSMVLETDGNIATVEDKVIHYWGNKDQWNLLINDFIIDSCLKKRNKETEIEVFKTIELGSIPINFRIQATNRRLKKLIDKLFSKKTILFFKH